MCFSSDLRASALLPSAVDFFFFNSKAGSETAGREVLSSLELDWTFPLGAESRQ